MNIQQQIDKKLKELKVAEGKVEELRIKYDDAMSEYFEIEDEIIELQGN